MGKKSSTLTALADTRVLMYGFTAEAEKAFPGTSSPASWQTLQECDSPCLVVAEAHSLTDEKFTCEFRAHADPSTKLLILNDTANTNLIASSLIRLNIRSPERFYVAEAPKDLSKPSRKRFFANCLARLSAGTQQEMETILDARVHSGILWVISTRLARLEVPIAKIPALCGVPSEQIENFEIDSDGSFLFWKSQGLHLGWDQLEQLTNPEAARKAAQKNNRFNRRYGAAIRKLREEASLHYDAVPGLSGRQLRRIESGECRATTSALRSLAQAHNMSADQYLEKLSETLPDVSPHRARGLC